MPKSSNRININTLNEIYAYKSTRGSKVNPAGKYIGRKNNSNPMTKGMSIGMLRLLQINYAVRFD